MLSLNLNSDSTPFWKRRRPWALAVCLAGAVWLAGCKPAQQASVSSVELPRVEVSAEVLELKTRPVIEEVMGTIRARTRATLSAKLSGRIEEMPVELGQQVDLGSLVARLEAAEVKARLEQAEASLQQAERDWNRAAELFKAQAMTRAEADAIEARWRVARAAVTEVRAALGQTEVLAPFSGVITRKWMEAGDLAQPGRPLVELENPKELQVEADVPEALLARIRPEGSLVVLAGDTNLIGTVREVAPAADPVTRSFQVKLDLPASAGLRAGQFARLQVPVADSQSLRVPLSAVVRRGQLEIAFVVKDQRAHMHLIKTGQQIGQEIEVLSGLESGNLVVVDGAFQLSDGQPVQAK